MAIRITFQRSILTQIRNFITYILSICFIIYLPTHLLLPIYFYEKNFPSLASYFSKYFLKSQQSLSQIRRIGKMFIPYCIQL